MNFKKKLGMGLAIAALGFSLIGGGTFAFFSDTEETHNRFTSGTLDLILKSKDDSEVVDVNLENLKPGDWKVHQFRLYNKGTLNFKDVKLNVDYTETDTNNNNNGEDFADHILIQITNTETNKKIVEWTPLSQLDDVVLSENLGAGERDILRTNFKFQDNGENQNVFMGDSLDFNLIFEASQEDGEVMD
ncbi:TasA family protein [Oceanobacillus massiliensis]|uniref:TasA family protein n=1 Tax=Oceanobacillus massiliensis TaxID=1465765 RepID=UPI00028A3D6A|nr:TasA family protein [Oceanobacillus massiliensis]